MSAPTLIYPATSSGGTPVGGTGTTNTIPRWTGASTLGDSILSQDANAYAIGVGAAPSTTWGSQWRALQVNSGAAFYGSSSFAIMAQNVVGRAGTDNYIANGLASRYYQLAGKHIWQSAVTGVAGNAITFATSMTIDENGNVGIGTASPTNNGAGTQTLMVNGSTTGVYDLGVNGARQGSWFYSGGSVNIGSIANVPFALVQNATIRWYINTSGHFLANADNTYDIGASGATRPRTVYAGTGVVGGYLRAGAASAGVASTTTIGNGTSTTATAGAQTLPANPLGFIIAHVGTTEVRIPYYAV